ncbi:MAG TPA: hypothetical protein VGA80_14125 [Flavobacteriaceae bacterium]
MSKFYIGNGAFLLALAIRIGQEWRSGDIKLLQGVQDILMKRFSRNGGTTCRGMGCNGVGIMILDWETPVY